MNVGQQIANVGSEVARAIRKKNKGDSSKATEELNALKTKADNGETDLYIESNDSITTVYATDGAHYRNKTSISQWEANLGSGFIRIHRSYLVNKSAITNIDTDIIYIGETELPISRKYKNNIHNL